MATRALNGHGARGSSPHIHRRATHDDLGPMPPLQPICPGCGGVLELLQPDTTRGDALLGSCPCCPAWYFIDLGSGEIVDLHLGSLLLSGAMLAELPA